jgi:hypothetical protein
MDLKELLGDMYTEEIQNKVGDNQILVYPKGEKAAVIAKLGDDGKLHPTFVPNSKIIEANESKKALQAEYDKLSESVKGMEKFVGENEELKAKLAESSELVKKANELAETEKANALLNTKKSRIEIELSSKHGVKPHLLGDVMNKIKLDGIDINDTGISGLENQVSPLKETYKEYFGEIEFRGQTPSKGSQQNGLYSQDQLNSMSDEQLVANYDKVQESVLALNNN